ncbi:MAG: hypothetical protein ACI85K_000963 [Hyphomicrobiaceae bacterium]|jgi:hypothetical protein
MNCNTGWKPKLGTALLALCMTHAANAQTPTPTATPQPAKLDALLGQLAKMDQGAWAARKQSMTAAAKQARADAVNLRSQDKAKQQAANNETAAATTLNREIKKLAEVRALLAKLTFRDPAGSGKSKDTAQGKLEQALAGLSTLPVAAWDARTSAMRAKAVAMQTAAANLVKAGKALEAQAAEKDVAAKAIDAELAKLDELQKLVGKLEIGVLAMTAASPPKPIAAQVTPAQATPAKTAPAKAKPKKAKAAVAKPAAKPAMKPKQVLAKSAAVAKTPKSAKPAASAKASGATAASDTATSATATPKAQPAKTTAVTVESDKSLLTYEDHVYEIFDEHCITCHEPSDPSGGLDLSTHVSALQGGGSGRTIRPGDADGSRLYMLVSHQEKPTMPPKSARLEKKLIDSIRTWIQQGAPKDLAEAKKLAVARAEARRKVASEDQKKVAEPKASVVMPGELPFVKKNYPENPGSMRTVAASPGAPLLAVPGFHQILLVHQDNLRELGVLAFPFGQVESLSFSQDGSTLIAAGGIAVKTGGAVLFEVHTGRELGRFSKRRDVLLSAAVSPDGSLVATGDTRRNVEVLRAADGQSLWKERHEDWVTAVTFSANGKLLASADRAGFVAVREADNGREVHEMKVANGLLADLAFSPNSSYLATAGSDQTVCLFRMSDGRQMFRQKRHSDAVLCVAWRSASHLISSGADGRILHWKTNGSRETELPRVRDWVYDVAASTDGSRIFTADWLGRLIAIDVKTRKVLATVTPLAVRQ